MKHFDAHMKIEMKVKDAQTNELVFPLNFYGADAPVKAVRVLIDKFEISAGEIYIPLETANLSSSQEPLIAPKDIPAPEG